MGNRWVCIYNRGQHYGGALKVMTGISEEGKVTGVSILSIDDTPGLGMNAKMKAFAASIYREVPGRRL